MYSLSVPLHRQTPYPHYTCHNWHQAHLVTVQSLNSNVVPSFLFCKHMDEYICDKKIGGMFSWKWFSSFGCEISLQVVGLSILLTTDMKIKRLSSYLYFIEDLIMQELLRSFMLEFRVRFHSSSLHKYLWRRKAKVDLTVLCLDQPIQLLAAIRVWWQIILVHLIAVGQCILSISSMNWNQCTKGWTGVE